MNTYCHEIKQHYETIWSQCGNTMHWALGPIHELPKDFCIVEIESPSDSHTWLYGTCGMSQPNDDDPLELHLLSPLQDNSNVELLTMASHYHRTGSRLGLGHTVNFGRPWLLDSTCGYGLVSLPYVYGSALEYCHNSVSNKCIRFLWLLPITEREREYKKQHGLEALEIEFEKAMVNYLDPVRISVV
jgi:hypothetical protein